MLETALLHLLMLVVPQLLSLRGLIPGLWKMLILLSTAPKVMENAIWMYPVSQKDSDEDTTPVSVAKYTSVRNKRYLNE